MEEEKRVGVDVGGEQDEKRGWDGEVEVEVVEV